MTTHKQANTALERAAWGGLGGGVTGGAVGGLTGGVTGAIDPDSNALTGLTRGVQSGSLLGAGFGASSAGLSHASPRIATGLANALVPLTALSGIERGLDTNNNRESLVSHLAKKEGSDFADTVQKIASSPTKMAMLGKHAAKGVDDEVFNAIKAVLEGGLKTPAKQELRQILMTSGIMAASTAGGMVLKDLLSDVAKGTRLEKNKRREETGKLQAQHDFRQSQVQMLQPIQHRVFNNVLENDEILKDADKDVLQSTFNTMQRFAPNLASDPNAVRSFLRESATFGTGPNYASLKNLADAERAVAQAGRVD